MSESMQNNAQTRIGNNLDHGQGSGEQASYNVPTNFGEIFRE